MQKEPNVPNRIFTDAASAPPSPHLTAAQRVSGDQKRIVLYSHDTMGLGHMRRNLLIAEALTASCPNASILMIAGAREITRFELPPGVDCVTLPGLHKNESGQYRSRHLSISLPDLLAVRRDAIRAVVASFQPHAIVVDKVAQGIGGELIPTLIEQHERGTACILGLRDILDEPAIAKGEWQAAGGDDWITRVYDRVWIYGDQRVYDAVREYEFSEAVANRTEYVGYLDQSLRQDVVADDQAVLLRHLAPGKKRVTCVLGGGQDGAALAEAFCNTNFGDQWHGILIAGPYLPSTQLTALRHLAQARSNLTLLPFTAAADHYLRSSDRVIAMGGYNTVCSVLSYNRDALIVPRVRPRQEQWIRASRMADLGLLHVLRPDQCDAHSMGAWLHQALPDRPDLRQRVDLHGLDRIAQWFQQLQPPRCESSDCLHPWCDEARSFDPLPHAAARMIPESPSFPR